MSTVSFFGLNEMIVVMVRVDWGRETIAEILLELRKHVELTLEEPGCDDFSFGIDVNNPNIVVASEVYSDYQAHLDHCTMATLQRRHGEVSAAEH